MSEKEASQKENTKESQNVFAAIYARTSSPNQRFNYSINELVERCWKLCNERGWRVSYVFIDECESGGTIERPKFQQMLEKAKTGKFDVIVFWKLDRFCRSLVDLVNIERKLREWDVRLCSVTEFIDTTTSVGRFNFRNMASFAEFERELIGERARIGLHALAKERKWPNPHPPLGYDKDEEGKLLVNADEAQLVRHIFKMYLQKKSMPQVAFELNEKGIRTKKGKQWNARAVRDILTNEIYIGRYCVAGFIDYVKEYRIVNDDLVRRANEVRLRYKLGKAKRPSMPENRRAMKIERMFNRYLQFLQEIEPENPSKMDGDLNDPKRIFDL